MTRFSAQYITSLASYLNEHAVKRGDFTLKSGQKSDWLVNLKEACCRPEGAHLCAEGLLQILEDDFPTATHVGGVAYGGIPLMAQVVMLARQSSPKVDGFYIRKEKKDHGTENLIDGVNPTNGSVVMLEDVTTTGGSVLSDIEMLRKIDINVLGVIAVLNRGGDEVEGTFVVQGLKYRSILEPHHLGLR